MNLKLLRVAAMLPALAGCSLPLPPQTHVSTYVGAQEITATAELHLFKLTSDGQDAAYLGRVQSTNPGIELPLSVQTHLASGSDIVKYVIRAYDPSATAGSEYFFEAPVLSSTLELNTVTTALWLALKFSHQSARQTLRLTRSHWENMLFLFERSCFQCRGNLTSTAWEVLRTGDKLRASIESQIDSGVTISSAVLASPPISLAKSDPAMINLGPLSLAANENDDQGLSAVFYAPDLSTIRLTPDEWTLTKPSNAVSSLGAATTSVNFSLDYDTAGITRVKAIKRLDDGRSAEVEFQIMVSDTDRAPIWAAMPTQSFKANHLGLFDVSPFVSDPDGDALTYSLLWGPAGLTMNGSILSWNPTQAPNPNQLGSVTVRVAVRDSFGISSASNIVIQATADTLPILSPQTSTWSVTEGSLSNPTFTIHVSDPDGDALEVACVSGCSDLLTGSPATATGVTVTAGTPGLTQSFSASYVPSYLETIGSNAQRILVFRASYDTVSSPTLRWQSAESPGITVNVINDDDPPSWTDVGAIEPGDQSFTEQSAVPANSFLAVDSPVNPSALTYSWASAPGTHCTWLTLDNTNKQITGTAGYDSLASCTFSIRATDAKGLSSNSRAVTYSIADLNRAPTASTVAFPTTIDEGATLSVNLLDKFIDADLTANDPRECVTYACTANCPTNMTITGTTLTWTPNYAASLSSPYNNITITATDKGPDGNCTSPNTDGLTATRTFSLTVNQAEGPMLIDQVQSGTIAAPGGVVTVTEGDSLGNVTFAVHHQPGDNYAYNLSVSCLPTCNPSLLSLPVNSGTTDQSFALNIEPQFTDGDGGPGLDYRSYAVTIQATKTDGTLPGAQTFALRVNNVNRPPTALVVDGDNDVTTYSFTIDGSRFNSNQRILSMQDPDGANDMPTFSFNTSNFPAIGTISGSKWTFNPLLAGCPANGTDTVVRTFDLRVSDNRGGTLSRRMRMTINNTRAGSGGNCPY